MTWDTEPEQAPPRPFMAVQTVPPLGAGARLPFPAVYWMGASSGQAPDEAVEGDLLLIPHDGG